MDQDRKFEHHKYFLEHAPAIITVIDADGEITYQSPTITHDFGYDVSELIGENALKYIHPDDQEQVQDVVSNVLEEPGGRDSVRYRFKDADGSWRWLESTGVNFQDDPVVDGIILSSIDVTELQAQEHRHETILESIHDGLVIIDDGGILYVNPRMTELTGYNQAEVLGKSFEEFIAEEDREFVLKRYSEIDEQGTSRESYNIEIVSKRGERIPVELSVGVIDTSEESRVIAVIRDIRQRVAREHQLRVLDRVLRHNLRNAMTTIQGYAETIRRETDAVEKEANNIINQITQLLQTVDKEREIVDVLCDPIKPTAVNISRTCEQRVNEMDEEYPTAKIETDIEDGVIAGATPDIDRAIEELLDNAICHHDREPPKVTISVKEVDDAVSITVSDTGPGISDDEIGVLTGKYEIDPLYHGSGLGLWLINWIVRQSQGILTFEANEPRGSSVTIELATRE